MRTLALMLYVERKPAAPLSRFVRVLWYVRAPHLEHRRERVLPSGCAQIILSLGREFLLDCPEGLPEQRTAPALIVGQRSIYELVDTSDFADLIGVAFLPGALPAFAGDRADLFSNCYMALDEVWSGHERALRDRLHEVCSAQERLEIFESFLVSRLVQQLDPAAFSIHPAVHFALRRFAAASSVASVAEVANETGWSERRFSQIFREQVGFAPKAWCRIQRFQRALLQLHAGRDIRWAEMAIECGFYDQSHFANEFRAFSGIDATTYTARRNRLWTNHARSD